MKPWILICLFSVVFLGTLWPNEQPEWMSLLSALRLENQRISNCLNCISEELMAIERAYAELEQQHEMMESELSASKQALKVRVKQLEEEQKLLRAEKAQSEKLEQELSVSEGSLTALKTTCAKTLQDAEAAIAARDTWMWVAIIGIPVGFVAGLIVGVIIK